MPRRTYVDPRFPRRLRELRQARGLSLRDLVRLTYFGKSTLSELENGKRSPSSETAGRLDRALDAAGELAGMVTEVPADPEADDRISHALARPSQIDRAAIDALAGVLAAERHLDDSLDAELLIPSVDLQWRTVSEMARDARGRHAGALHRVVAEWTQFLGWMHAEARHDAEAVRVLTEAARQAEVVDDGPLRAQVENFRGFLERQRGNPRGIVRHFMAAYEAPGATTLQRVGDAVQAAHGFALFGDRRTAERLLGEASDLTEAAESEDAPSLAYWLSPTFSRMGIGLAHLALGNKVEAAANLKAGLTGLPDGQREAEWAAEYRDALAEAVE